MKLTVFLFTVFIIQVQASEGTAQTVSLTGKDLSLKTVFAAVQQQTGYTIFGKREVLENSKPVTIMANNMPLKAFLDEVLKDQQINYQVNDRSISLSKRTPAAEPADMFPLPGPVKGVVRGSDGQPLAGANIIVKGFKKGTVTAADGSFSIDAQPGDVIEITFIGFDKQSVTVKDNIATIDVMLKPSETSLNEVTVSTGYWTTTKRLSTGNISKVTAEDIERQPVTNPLLALQGRVPGLEIAPNTGAPGGAIKFTVRGRNSLRNNSADETANSPLIVIDGIPIDASPLRSGVAATSSIFPQGYDPLSTLNPANIESVEVLKDADATAIYGSRGANGVILITTKKGNRAKKTNVDIGIYSGAGKIVNRLDLLNTQEYIAMRKEALANNGMAIDYNWDINGHWDQNRYTDWQKVLLGGTSRINDVQAGVSGGNAATSFKFDLAYHKENVVYSGDFGFQRLSGNLNINHLSLNQKLNIGVTINYGFNNNKTFESDFIDQALTLAPNAPDLYDIDGKLNWDVLERDGYKFSAFNNPLAKLKNTNQSNFRNIISNAIISYQIFPGLAAKINAGLNDLSGQEFLKFPIEANAPIYIGPLTTASNTFGSSNRRSWIIEPQINFTKRINHHNINVVAGASVQESIAEYKSILGFGYVSDVLLDNLNAANQTYISVDSYNDYNYLACYIRIGYNWKEKYLFNLTGRRDGSSRFSPGNRYGNFGAIGAAWIFSEEDFIKKHLDFLSFGKIRGSYGITGNDQIGDYKFYNTYRIAAYAYDDATTLTPTALFNPEYVWETTKKAEVGIELGFINDRLSIQTSYYSNASSNQLVQYQLPAITGFDEVLSNFDATVRNSGWETVITAIPMRNKSFSWEASLNISANRNKLIEFPGIEASSYARLYKIGEPLSVRRMYLYDQVDPATGKYVLKDINNDGMLNDKDENFISAFEPKYFGGLNNVLRFRSFELSLLLQFISKNGLRYFPGTPGMAGNQPRSVLNRWQKPGDITNVARFTTDYMEQHINSLYLTYSDFMIEDASFIRLKTLGISYTIPEKIIARMGLDQVRFFIQGQNLFTLTNSTSFDPETGISMPPLRMLNFGIQLRL